MNSEIGPTPLQKTLIHGASKDIHYAREKLKGIRLTQRISGQPKLLAAASQIDEHLRLLWHLIDGLDDTRSRELRPCSEA